MSTRTIILITVGVVVLALLPCGGCFGLFTFGMVKGMREAAAEIAASKVTVPAPTGQLVLSQTLDFSDGEQTMQGSSFLARTPGGSVVIVTAAHFLDFDGPALVRLSAFGEVDVATSTVAFGMPGNAGIDSPAEAVDLRPDYVLLMPESEPVGATVLEMDDRPLPRRGEKVWMPDAIGALMEPPGELLTGIVDETDQGWIMIKFDRGQYVELMGASGGPVISQRTGKVIGIISRGGKIEGDDIALLTPAHGVLKAMRDAERSGERPRLRECVGKDGGQ
jgi:hypothetical protein